MPALKKITIMPIPANHESGAKQHDAIPSICFTPKIRAGNRNIQHSH
jgi:hypothetical protein